MEKTPLFVRPPRLAFSERSAMIVREILSGARPNRDLKIAFDWENTPEGHRYWSKQYQNGLSREATEKLTRASGYVRELALTG